MRRILRGMCHHSNDTHCLCITSKQPRYRDVNDSTASIQANFDGNYFVHISTLKKYTPNNNNCCIRRRVRTPALENYNYFICIFNRLLHFFSFLRADSFHSAVCNRRDNIIIGYNFAHDRSEFRTMKNAGGSTRKKKTV